MCMFRNSSPLFGIHVLSSSVTRKWLGAGKPGQKHGLVTLTGIPRGPGGEFRIDPEMMKRMQQMQQSIGR